MRRASLGTIFLTVFLDLLGFGLVVPYLPGVARSYGATALVATLLGAAYSAMQLVFVPFWGHLSDRVGRRPLLLGGIAASVVGMLLLGTASSLTMLFVARIWSGIATANIAVAQAYIADVTRPEDRARGMGLIGAGIGLGFVFGPVVGGLLEVVSPLQRAGALPAYAAAGLAVVNLVLALVYLPESLPADRRGQHVRSASPFDVRRFRLALSFRGVGEALLINFVVVLSFSALEQTFRLFSADAFAMGVHETGYVLGLVGVVLIVVQGGLIRPLIRRFGEPTLVRVGIAVQVVGFALVAESPSLPRAVVALCVGMSTIALGSGLSNPSLSSLVSRSADERSQGSVLGVLQSAGAFARVWGPAAGGALYDAIGPRAPYFAAAGGMLVATALTLRLRLPAVADAVAVPRP